jgi:hypothetical protein
VTAVELRQRRAFIANTRADLRNVPLAWQLGVTVEPAKSEACIIRDREGNPLAKFRHGTDGYLFSRAPRLIEDLLDTLEEMQEELREARMVRRSYAVVTNHLLMAQRAGFSTQEGKTRVKAAHAEALDPTPNREYDW